MSRKERGFSLLELVCVVVIIGLLAAEGLRRYMALQERASEATVTMLSQRFAAATSSVHAQWKISVYSPEVAANIRNDGAVLIEQMPVFVNQYGWPVNTDGSSDRGSMDQSAFECWQLWQTLLQNPAPASVEGFPDTGLYGDRPWHISSYAGAVCRFEWTGLKRSNVELGQNKYFFDYSVITGHIKNNQN